MGKKNKPKPEGPVYVDMRGALFAQLSVSTVIEVANLALNRLTVRDWGEIFHEAGVEARFGLAEEEPGEAQE